MLNRPGTDEFAEYYRPYVARVPEGDVRHLLRSQMHETIALLSSVPEATAGRAYGPGKWTLKEVVLHMADTERVFGYRLLRVGRNDPSPLSAFDENAWVPHSCANDRPMSSLVMEFAAVRGATLALIDGMPEGAWERRGTASGHTVSARALVYICAGHERHHLAIIRERYLTAV